MSSVANEQQREVFRDDALFLVFQSENDGERTAMHPCDLLEVGTPIDIEGDDMQFIGFTRIEPMSPREAAILDRIGADAGIESERGK